MVRLHDLSFLRLEFDKITFMNSFLIIIILNSCIAACIPAISSVIFDNFTDKEWVNFKAANICLLAIHIFICYPITIKLKLWRSNLKYYYYYINNIITLLHYVHTIYYYLHN